MFCKFIAKQNEVNMHPAFDKEIKKESELN